MKKDSSGLVINSDIDEFHKYKLERAKVVRQKSLEQRVEKLESDISELKSILQSIQSRID
jgi:uncharacterized protein YceH (UPF0502 family)